MATREKTVPYSVHIYSIEVESNWNVMAHGYAREGKWRGNWRIEWVTSTRHTTSEHGVSCITIITTADVHTSAAGSRLNWRPRWFKWTRLFRRRTKSGFCASVITFLTQSISNWCQYHASDTPPYANKLLESATNIISGSKKIVAHTLV
jgi:hypothetical protein